MGEVLGVLGLVFALYQINKAERAALAAKRAVEQTSGQVNVYSLLLLIPELALVERELERVAEGDSHSAVKAVLRTWHERLTELDALLEIQEVNSDDLAVKVQTSLTLASQARGALGKATVSPAKATKRTREAAYEVVLSARKEGAQVRASIPAPEPVTTLLQDIGTAIKRVGKKALK